MGRKWASQIKNALGQSIFIYSSVEYFSPPASIKKLALGRKKAHLVRQACARGPPARDWGLEQCTHRNVFSPLHLSALSKPVNYEQNAVYYLLRLF